MPSRRPSLSNLIKHLWSDPNAELVPLNANVADFPGGVYDPRYDFIRMFAVDVERGAALSMVGLFETAITDVLKHSLVYDKNLFTEMFRETGAFGALAKKVRLGYLIGLYSHECLRDFERIYRIRNRFAHATEARTFSDTKIKGLTKALTLLDRAKVDSNVIIKECYDENMRRMSQKDLRSTSFLFMANIMFAITYFLAWSEFVKKDHQEGLSFLRQF
jgi:DNA-binding MltR family transcriptional regulator